MNFSIDARLSIPPLLNLIIFFLFLKSEGGSSWDLQDGTSKILLYPILKMQFPFVIPAMLLSLLFLFSAVKLPFKVGCPIISCNRELSVLLALLILASVILAPSLFLVVYFCLIILSFCYAMLASPFKRFFNWCRPIPSNDIPSINENAQEDAEPAARQVELRDDIEAGNLS